MRLIGNCILLVLINYIAVADNIHTYEEQKVKSIPFGKGDDQLGYMPHLLGAGGNPGPTTFTISDDGLIYICDVFNSRIVVYTLSLDFVRKIEIKDNYMAGAYKIKIDQFNNIIGIDATNSLSKIDGKGKELFKIWNYNLSDNIRNSGDFFPVNNYVLINDSKEGAKLVDEKGKLLDRDTSRKMMNNMQGKSQIMAGLSTEAVNEINKFKENKKIEMRGNRILSTNPENHKYIYSKIRKSKKQIQPLIEPENVFVGLFEAYDKDDNAYFIDTQIGHKRAMIVYSKNGDLLDCFYIPTSAFAVAPNGDIYFMETAREKEAIPFYKIVRRW